MKLKYLGFGFLTVALLACNSKLQTDAHNEAGVYPDLKIAGAMKDVMWNGALEGIIKLDSIENKEGLYGIGPESFLTGEILINNGKAYLSKVLSDSTMTVEQTFNTSAPFFVYGNVTAWDETELPTDISTIADLEEYVNTKTDKAKRPFAFKLIGEVTTAKFHIQNLPKGTKVSSPDEAHQGQVSYYLTNEPVEIIGFFSTDHKGIFTHHDSFLHLHLITQDEEKMGHLDEALFGEMKLYLPNK